MGHPSLLAAAKRAQAAALHAQADALNLEADALDVSDRDTDPWIHKENCLETFGFRFRRLVDAAKRGEIEMGRAGRSPRVLRSVVDAWIVGHPVTTAQTPTGDADADYAALIGGSH
jgi:hypothetical protein